VTSRSRPQQTAQIFSPFAGQKRFGGRFSHIEQLIEIPRISPVNRQAGQSDYGKKHLAASRCESGPRYGRSTGLQRRSQDGSTPFAHRMRLSAIQTGRRGEFSRAVWADGVRFKRVEGVPALAALSRGGLGCRTFFEGGDLLEDCFDDVFVAKL